MKKKILFVLMWWMTIPHIIVSILCKERLTLLHDIKRWSNVVKCPFNGINGGGNILSLSWLLINIKEFRNVFYLRVGIVKYFLMYLPPLSSLYINMKSKNFGAGTVIQHGFATIITAEHIGKDCWINQQVTIGYNNSKTKGYGRPWIGDNVRISAGGKVCGPIVVGDNSTIGVNAAVTKDVPFGSVVIPSPMMLIQENYKKVYKKL